MSAVPKLVTIDGPAGSGKTTLGRRLALWLEVPLIDTGLLYRAVTVLAASRGVAAADPTALAELASTVAVDIATDPRQNRPRVSVDGHDVTGRLHDPKLAPLLAAVSREPAVRSALLDPQRRLAQGGDGVAVGRDCGTVVFPAAPVKLYLEAAEAVRLERRARQLVPSYGSVDSQTLTAEVEARDRSDATRTAAPMRPADDAVVIRTDQVGVEETVALAVAACRRAGMVP